MVALTFDGVACTAPDGTPLFSGLTLSVDREVVGVVGRNGAGKSTLLRAVMREVPLAAGTIVCAGRTGFLRQQPLDPSASVAAVLGVADSFARLRRAERGTGTAIDHEEVDWSLRACLQAAFADAGLQPLELDREVATLSGGERTRLMLAALLLPAPDIILLDEPTNNLDDAGRSAIREFLRGWAGPALVASHDRGLLESMDRIVELTAPAVRVVGGGWAAFEQVRAAESERAAAALEKASAKLSSARRERQRETEKQARRDRRGRNVAAKGIDPKIHLHAQQQRAEKSGARYRAVGQQLEDRASEKLAEARANLERLVPVRIALPKSGLPARHRLVDARGLTVVREGRRLFRSVDLSIVGPQRIELAGPNGSGKTSLIRVILGLEPPESGTIAADHGRMVLLDQDLALLKPWETLLATMQRHNPQMDRQKAYRALAAYGFRNQLAQRETASLSGGERVRLALACLFSRPEPPQMLILDEPTNNLDMAAIEQLEAALSTYDGAILCVSHDAAFRSAIGLSEKVNLVEGEELLPNRSGHQDC